jgi:hypothetical protein
MAVSSQDGRVVAKAETCGDADDMYVDPKRHRVYVSCGAGAADVFDQQRAEYGRLAGCLQCRWRDHRFLRQRSIGSLSRFARSRENRPQFSCSGLCHEGRRLCRRSLVPA